MSLDAAPDLLIGVDAGTSVIKAVAFTLDGETVGISSEPNHYETRADGAVDQDIAGTWAATARVLCALGQQIPGLAARVQAMAVTGQGDGTWLVDAAGAPVHRGWLWLDSRSARQVTEIEQSPEYERIYRLTGTGVNVCQMRSQLRWLQQNQPDTLKRAAVSFHCKDYLYYRMTGVFATDPSESVFTFGDFRHRDYSEEVIDGLGLSTLRSLFPPIVDGVELSHKLSDDAARQTGLSSGTPVVLGFVDVICSALGGGLVDAELSPGMSILGSTGMHMRYQRAADGVQLNDERTGYTMLFPGGGYAQMQSNMAATLNLDWWLDLALELLRSQGFERTRGDLLPGLDERILQARPGVALFHPYISTAGERGPFINPLARAGFTGVDQTAGYFDLLRSVFEGLAFAAKDCFEAMGEIPAEIRISGGAARSTAMCSILASVLQRPVRVVDRAEAGASGAVMMALVQQRHVDSIEACAEAWVNPRIGAPVEPDTALAGHYASLFPIYRQARLTLTGIWDRLGAVRLQAIR